MEVRKIQDVRHRAWAFLLKLHEETEKRLPSNIEVFKQASFFHPSEVLSSKQIRFGQMPFLDCLANEDAAELEEEWRQLRQVNQLRLKLSF
jgi:hypothetical protein